MENDTASSTQTVVAADAVQQQKNGFLRHFGNQSKKVRLLLVAGIFGVVGSTFLAVSHASTSSLAIDVRVSTHQSLDQSSITSQGFSTKGSDELLVAFIDSNGPGRTTQTFSSVTGGGLTWKLRSRSNAQNGTAEIWQAVAPNPLTNISVVATRSSGKYSGDITVVGFTGAVTTADGAAGSNSGRSGAPTISVTATKDDSQLWATGNDWDSAISRTVPLDQTLVDQYVYTGESTTYWTQSQGSGTSALAGKAVTLNDTKPTVDRWNYAAIEILPLQSGTTPPPASTPPSAPTNLTAANTTDSATTLSWTASTAGSNSLAGYRVYRNGTQLTTTTSATYTDAGLTASTAYSYYVVAYDTASGVSAASNTVMITTSSTPSSTCPVGTTGTPPNCTPVSGGSTPPWQPAQNTPWQWEIGTPLDVNNATQMGIGVTAYNGNMAPGDNPQLIDIDAIQNPATTVASLHAKGIKAVCYVEVGTAGSYYSAAAEGIPTTYYDQLKAAGDLGYVLKGYAKENFVNITSASAVAIEEAQIKEQCVNKGFDAVETDLDETWGNNEGGTGFGTFTQAQEETYLTTLANYMHANKISWIAKNLDDEGSASFVANMEPLAQGIVSEECNKWSTCDLLAPFLTAHKWIGNAEYTQDSQTTASFCPNDNNLNINGILFDVNLDGTKVRQPCR